MSGQNIEKSIMIKYLDLLSKRAIDESVIDALKEEINNSGNLDYRQLEGIIGNHLEGVGNENS
ncbi:MAG: hypothetical protein GF364_10060 [Candidatus Lokiarchaeota archaeon]|nr:hypothetical protein [Candidatus Lokiarchaeota archaeon]